MHERLALRGLAGESQDGFSVPLHPLARSVYLVVLAQLARYTGARHGLDLQPVTHGRGATRAVERFLDLGPMPSRGQVVSFDLEVVGVDLDPVPLDEVLDFRSQHREAHRRYLNARRAAGSAIQVGCLRREPGESPGLPRSYEWERMPS
jgi:hypothetical protein